MDACVNSVFGLERELSRLNSATCKVPRLNLQCFREHRAHLLPPLAKTVQKLALKKVLSLVHQMRLSYQARRRYFAKCLRESKLQFFFPQNLKKTLPDFFNLRSKRASEQRSRPLLLATFKIHFVE